MLHEVNDAISEENKYDAFDNRLFSSKPMLTKATVFNCSTSNCSGFSYAPDVACTVCGETISNNTKMEKEVNHELHVEQVGVKKRIIEKHESTLNSTQHAYPLVIVSLGKSHVFDARQKPCIITADSLAFGATCQGKFFYCSRHIFKVNGFQLLSSMTR